MLYFRTGLGVAALATLVTISILGLSLDAMVTGSLYMLVGWVLPDPSKFMPPQVQPPILRDIAKGKHLRTVKKEPGDGPSTAH